MAEKKTSVKYKFGQKELDMDKYIRNIGGNVQSYLEDRRKHGWTDDQVQEFSTAYNRYMDAFKLSMTANDNRFSTDDLGNITDTKGEFTNIDNDDNNGGQYYYNNKGERITNTDYDALKDRKKKKYQTFNANRLVAEYFRKIGNALLTEPPKEAEKFDLAKHGFVAWWNQKYNPSGGEVNLKPFLDKDPVGADGKRPVSARAKMAAGWMDEYLNWLQGKDLDYSNYDQFKDYDTYAAKGKALAQKWGDGNWEADDLIEGQAFGISNDFSNGFFSTEENPDLTDDQRATLAAQLKAKEEEEKQKAILEAKRKWISDQQAIFNNSGSTFTFDNPFTGVNMDTSHWYNADGTLNTENYYGAWGSEFLNPDKSINTQKLQTYIDQYVQNPFAAQYAGSHARNIVGLINAGIAQQIPSGDYQGMYYIPSKSDEAKNRALIYDPNTKKMFYAFVGHVPQVWTKLTNRYKVDNGMVDPSDQFMFKDGGVVSMQTGGDFGNAFVQGRNLAVEKAASNAGTNARKYLNDRRKISGEANTFDTQNGGLTEADKYHIAGLIGDVTSLIGNPVGAGIGLAGTASHFIGDIKEDGFQWSDVGRAAVGAGLDVLGMIPGASAAKFGNIANGIIKVAPKLAAIVATTATVANAGPILASLKKVTTLPSNMTIEDWRNVSQALILSLGFARGKVTSIQLNKAKPKTGEVALDLKNKNTGEIETRRFSEETAKKLQEAKSNDEIVAILRNESPALGEYDLATSTSWIPRLRWIRKNGWIGDGWQPPVHFDSKRVRPMVVRTDKKAGNIDYAIAESPLTPNRTKLVSLTKEEVNEGVVKSEMDKLVAASKEYEKELKAAPNRIKAAKVSKEKVEKALKDKDFVKQEDFDSFKSKGEGMKGNGHDSLIDKIIARKLNMMTEEGAKQNKKYYESLIKKLEEFKANGHTKAYEDLKGRVNSEGVIEFTTPGGETIKRDFARLMQRYKISHKEGGKFSFVRKYQNGNPITNVHGNADWFRDMYKHPSMTSWLTTWNAKNYKDFNELQDSWYNNWKTTGYDPNNPEEARGEGDSKSTSVWDRQGKWNLTGTNAAIEDAVNKKILTRNGGTSDNPNGKYLDGYFGAQEFLRHGGTEDSWFNHDEELKAQKELFRKNGLDYYPDENGMYKLRPLNSGEVPQNVKSTVTEIIGNGDKLEKKLTNNTIQQGLNDLSTLIPSAAHLVAGNYVNSRMAARSMEIGPTIYDPKHNYKYVKGDFDSLMAGQLAAGQLMHMASQPLTSDGQVQTAGYLDAVNKALDYFRQGRSAWNQEFVKRQDELWKLLYDDDAFNYNVAMKNRASIDDNKENKINIANALDAKNWANWETFWQERMQKIKQKENKREALEEKFAISDIHNMVYNSPNDYEAGLDGSELTAWNLVQSGDKTYSQLDKALQAAFLKAQRKVSLAEQNQVRGYYGIPQSKYAGARTFEKEWKADTSFKKGGILQAKDGAAKVAVAKIRERSKDADRFHKNTKDRHDRVDKAIARIDKKMYRRRDPEKRGK